MTVSVYCHRPPSRLSQRPSAGPLPCTPRSPENRNAMARHDNDDNRSVALYWDFENLHASLVEDRHGEGTYG